MPRELQVVLRLRRNNNRGIVAASAYDVLLSSSKVVTFRTFANCVGAVRAYFDHHAFRVEAPGYEMVFRQRAPQLGFRFLDHHHAC